MPAPSITSVSPESEFPGRPVTIRGDNFGPPKPGSEVRLRLRAAGAATVAAAVPQGAWRNKQITATVPQTQQLGSGGVADLWVHTAGGDSQKRKLTVKEPSPPSLSAVTPPEQLAGEHIEIIGQGLGITQFETHAVLIDAPPGAIATVPQGDWSATHIRAQLPPAAALGPPGEKRVRVHTLWGDSNDLTFVLAAKPAVTAVVAPKRPDEPALFLSGDELVVKGTAFGQGTEPEAKVTIAASDGQPVTLERLEWKPTTIRVRVPIDADFGAPAGKPLVVTTKWGASEPFAVSLEAPPSLNPVPLVGLPLRLETRFSEDRTELWVRAVPDAIHRNDHQEQITAEERSLGEAYRDAPPADREDAWRRLAARVGPTRAAWVARVVSQPPPATPSEDPAERWARAAHSRLLPRRLYAFAYVKGEEEPVARAWSRPIPYTLRLGPDPTADTSGGELRLDEGMRWMVELGAAVESGMALKLSLPERARAGIQRLVVVGAETSIDPQAAATELGDSLLAQRFSRGLGFLPEGTPTNNTAEGPAFHDAPDAGAPAAAQPQAATATDAGSNAFWAARALGLTSRTAELFGGLADAGSGKELREARGHMNAAIWPHLRYFVDHMMAPAIGSGGMAAAREHFVSWVRGCGPLPVLRVGEQPYALLPVTPLAELEFGENDPLGRLAHFLDATLRPIWRRSTANVPRVSDSRDALPGQSAVEHPLLTALSMQPTSISYRGRSVLGARFADAAWRFMRETLAEGDPRIDENWWHKHTELARKALDDAGLDWEPVLEHTVFAANYFPTVGALVQDGGSRDAPLQRNWVRLLNRVGWKAIRDEAFAPNDPDAPPPGTPSPLAYLLLRHALLLAYLFTAADQSASGPWRGGEPEFPFVDEAEDIPTATRDATVWDMLESPVGGQPVGERLDAAPTGELAAVRAALDKIEQLMARAQEPRLSAGELARVVAETLDLCSFRLDAWLSSFAMRRLDELRATVPDGAHYIAYGFVEDLVPTGARESAGYIHTPSPSHATAAAILASGYRSHRPQNGNGRPFGIDLSSARVRRVLSLLDGVRAGQPLGALLGYGFERGLQERGVARYIEDFRSFAPLPVSGTAPASGAVTSVAARNVVDGLELHRRWVASGRVLGEGWPGLDAPDTTREELLAELRGLDDAVDAISDILVTEGVYQAGRGNSARARAALEAAARPSGPPPELEAVYTPHAGLGVVHRLLMLLPGESAPDPAWHPDPVLERRAPTEPRLERWARGLLGDPKRVRFRVEYREPEKDPVEREMRLDQIQPALSALDVVYAAVASERGQLSEMEQRIVYHAVRTRPDGVSPDASVRVIASRQPELEHKIGLLELMELAQALRETIAGARPVEPDDLALPDAQGTTTVDVDELSTRATSAADALKAAADQLDVAIADGTAEPLRAALLSLSAFGVPGAVPVSAFGDSDRDRADLRAQALAVRAEAGRRLTALPTPEPPADDPLARRDHALARIAAVFGPAFRAVPLVSAPPAGDPAQLDVAFPASATLRGTERFAATTWFERMTRVRDGARRLGDALDYANMLGGHDPLRLEIAQLPAAPGDRWVALPFDGAVPKGRVSIVGYLPDGPLEAAKPAAGLVVDEFTEVLPAPEKTTGLAVHYDQPNATAPQAILIGVPPKAGERWTLERMRDLALEALDLARLRMVDLPALEQAGHFLPALYLGLNLQGVTVATDLKNGAGIRLA